MSIAHEPAFPTQRYLTKDGGGYLDLGEYMSVPEGLTKREHFAAIALQGLLANSEYAGSSPSGIAAVSVEHADALVAELLKPIAKVT